MFKVRKDRCPTCIYNEDSPLAFKLLKLEAAVRDEHGHYTGWRVCHYTDSSCCRGFYDAHGDNCLPIQLAERCGALEFTNKKGGSPMFRKGSQLQLLYEIFLASPNNWITSPEAARALNALREDGTIKRWKYFTSNTSPMLGYLFKRGAVERMNIGTDTARRYAYRLKERPSTTALAMGRD